MNFLSLWFSTVTFSFIIIHCHSSYSIGFSFAVGFSDRKMSVYKIAVITFEIISTKCAKTKNSLKISHWTMIYGEVQNTSNYLHIYISYLKHTKYKKSMLRIILESFPLLSLKDNKLVWFTR